MYYALVNESQSTGNTKHLVGGELVKISGLAICKYENDNGCYLFYCDKEWGQLPIPGMKQ